jgi:WD40 repeat protein
MEPVDNEFYAKGVSFDAAANSLYVTTGTTNAHLYKYNLTTNTRSADLMPAAYANEEIADMTRVIDNKLFLRLVPSQQGLVLNKSTHAVEHVIPSVNSYEYSGKSPIDDKVYYTSQGMLYSYDLSSQAETALVDLGSNLLAGTEFLQLNEPNLSGYSLVGMTRAGTMIKYNLQTGYLKKVTLDLPEQPARIKYIIGGDDGKIYSSPFLGSGLGIYDPVTGKTIQYSGLGVGSLGQVEGAGKMNGKLYFGVYANANIFEYDPSQPYVSGTNPRNMFNLGASPHEQDRPYAVLGVEAHNKLFIGTVPFYGSLQGAFSIYDFNTDTVQVNKNIITNQSVISLAYHNGKVYGGTTIAGGLGSTPTATEAKLFIWDIATGQKTFETVPVAGKKSITSLNVGPDGNIWGFAEGTLFVFNTTTKTVTYSAQKFSVTYSAGKWADVFMELAPDGNFFGTIASEGKFFMLSPTTKNVTIMRNGPFELFTQDNQGGLYFVNNDTELWKYSDPHLTN